MDQNEYYHSIFKRKSIRNFDLRPLDDDTLADISNHLRALESMHDDIKIELKIISPDNVKRRMMKRAPHYIAVFSEAKAGYLTNIGFMLQQIDLYLSHNSLGSCWQGIPSPKKEVLESSNLEFVIFIAFGKPKDPQSLHRTKISEFKRKSLHEITDIKGADELLEAVRLAPSSTNGQPWFFTGDENIINVLAVKPNFVKALLVKDYYLIDIGIAIYHLKVAAEHLGKKTEILFDEPVKSDAFKGYEYIISLKLD